uniref:Uncharacterized protein n=1 Tax=Candidatus Kentrum sp. FM TaxID=2126340 RepID=A0A450X6I3_9GAMM|nr:MAG: hypothetical protein BECKFM1743B_GA0114221_110221 [Candidatus Kentron sp. FM]
MSEYRENTSRSESNEAQEARHKNRLPGRLLAWGKENSSYLLFFAMFVLALVLLLMPLPEPEPDTPPDILDFVRTSYILLIIGLFSLLFFWILPNHDEITDLESRMRVIIYGMLAILAMLTILGIASLIVWAIVQQGPPDHWGAIRR